MWLEGKTTVVTGAAGGIGRACAAAYARSGGRVALLDLDNAALDEVASDLRSAGAQVLPVEVDLMSTSDVQNAFAQIERAFGPVDVLLNNVGRSARSGASTFRNSREQSWDEMIGICLKTALVCTHQVIGSMQDRRYGRIVNIASDAAYIGSLSSAAYAAAKGGVIGFTHSLAREVAGDGVTVNSVAPGPTRTRAARELPADVVDRLVKGIPAGAMCEPEDIANAVLFLSTDQSRYVTGQTLMVNGGRWML